MGGNFEVGVGGCLIRFFGLVCDVMCICRATEGRVGLWFSVGVVGLTRHNITKDQTFVFVRNGVPCFLASRFKFVPGSKIHSCRTSVLSRGSIKSSVISQHNH